MWASGQPWRLVHDLAIGEVEGDGAAVFAQIAGIEVDEEGRIYVLDRQANELRIFAPNGSHIRTVGRKTAGPGEYSAANGLLWLAPDSLLVINQQSERFTVLTKDGQYVRSINRGPGTSARSRTPAFTGTGSTRSPLLNGMRQVFRR